MNIKTFNFYLSICALHSLDIKKVYQTDFKTLQIINDFDMFGIAPRGDSFDKIKELVTRASSSNTRDII